MCIDFAIREKNIKHPCNKPLAVTDTRTCITLYALLIRRAPLTFNAQKQFSFLYGAKFVTIGGAFDVTPPPLPFCF